MKRFFLHGFLVIALSAALAATLHLVLDKPTDDIPAEVRVAAGCVLVEEEPKLVTLTMPRTAEPPESEAPVAAPETNSRYAALNLTQDDIDLMAKIVYLEARGEPEEGQQAVAEVILNRVKNEWFPDTVSGVIYEDGQFTTAAYVDQAEPTYAQYAAIESALTGESILPEDVVFFATTPENSRLWGWIGAHAFCREYIWE